MMIINVYLSRMKICSFNNDEISFLKQAIAIRIEESNNFNISRNRFYINIMDSLYTLKNKIETLSEEPLNKKEINTIVSCTNGCSPQTDGSNRSKPLAYWMQLSGKEKQQLEITDIYKSILTKCKYYRNAKKNPRISNKEILSRIEKLKNANTTLFSVGGNNNYYKIGFLYDNNELMTFELKSEISIIDNSFVDISTKDKESFLSQRFDITTNRTEAKILLSQCTSTDFNSKTIDFLNYILT